MNINQLHLIKSLSNLSFEPVNDSELPENIRVFTAYASIYNNMDSDDDIIERGAFKGAIERFRNINNIVPMKYRHEDRNIIGGFPLEKMREDDNGLFVEGHINIDIDDGKRAYALMKQGVINGLSFQGEAVANKTKFIEQKGGRRSKRVGDLNLYEISVTERPANNRAKILMVKSESNIDSIKTIDDLKSFLAESYYMDEVPMNKLINGILPRLFKERLEEHTINEELEQSSKHPSVKDPTGQRTDGLDEYLEWIRPLMPNMY